MKFLFIIFILPLGWSAEGIHRGSPWESPGTWSVAGVLELGVGVFGLPTSGSGNKTELEPERAGFQVHCTKLSLCKTNPFTIRLFLCSPKLPLTFLLDYFY